MASAALAGAALPAVGLMTGTASAATQSCSTTAGVVTCVFGSDGTPTTWPVPAGITGVTVTADGADGASGGGPLGGSGGDGGEMRASLTNIPAGTSLVVFPGGRGFTSGSGGTNLGPNTGTSSGGAAGIGTLSDGGGGGGASTVSLAATGTQFSNVLVAAGGGGGGATFTARGGNGGSGAHPNGFGGAGLAPGGGGTQSTGGGGGGSGTCTSNGAGGSALTGGNGGGGGLFCANGGGAGGSGYYGGGGGGGGLVPLSSGGGGSSFPASTTTVGGITVTPDSTDATLWTGGNGQVTISYALIPTSTSVSCVPNPSTTGQSVTCTATITPGAATGTVQFQAGSTTISGCGAVAVSAGQAACTTTSLPAGSDTITATYTPTTGSGWTGSYNTTVQTVLITTTTSLTSAPNPSNYGQSVTLTATVSPTDGGGTVAFKDGGTDIPGCGSQPLVDNGGTYQATCVTSSLSGGTHTLTAVYSGDSVYAGSTSNTVQQVVNALPTRLRVWLVVHADGTYTLYALLTTSGGGLSGQPIGFVAGHTGPGLCKAATDANGVASCYLDRAETRILLRYWGAFTAEYGGTTNWQRAVAYYPGIMWF